MTMVEIKKEINKRRRFCKLSGLEELIGWYDEMNRFITDLYENSYTESFTNDMLRVINGYRFNTEDAEFHVTVCLDLRNVAATKRAVRRFAEYLLNV